MRLRRAADFEHILLRPRKAGTRNFAVWLEPNGRCDARLGIIAGRKTAPRAVDRNRGKRLIRECFRAALTELSGADVIVQMRTPLHEVDNDALRAEIRRLLHTAARKRTDESNGR